MKVQRTGGAIVFWAWFRFEQWRLRRAPDDASERDDVSPQRAADRIAEARLEAIGKLKMPMGRSVPRMNRLRGE